MSELLPEGAAPEAQAGEAAAPAPAAPAEAGTSAWSPSQDEWGAVMGYLQQTAPVMNQIMALMDEEDDPDQQQQQLPDDPRQMAQQMFNEQMEPFKPLLGQIAAEKGEQIARNHLQQIQSEIGEFDHDQAIVLTQGFMNQGMDPHQALQIAARQQRQFEQGLRERAIKEHEESLQRRSDLPAEPPVQGAGAENPPTPQGRGAYEELASRWLAAQKPTTSY